MRYSRCMPAGKPFANLKTFVFTQLSKHLVYELGETLYSGPPSKLKEGERNHVSPVVLSPSVAGFEEPADGVLVDVKISPGKDQESLCPSSEDFSSASFSLHVADPTCDTIICKNNKSLPKDSEKTSFQEESKDSISPENENKIEVKSLNALGDLPPIENGIELISENSCNPSVNSDQDIPEEMVRLIQEPKSKADPHSHRKNVRGPKNRVSGGDCSFAKTNSKNCKQNDKELRNRRVSCLSDNSDSDHSEHCESEAVNNLTKNRKPKNSECIHEENNISAKVKLNGEVGSCAVNGVSKIKGRRVSRTNSDDSDSVSIPRVNGVDVDNDRVDINLLLEISATDRKRFESKRSKIKRKCADWMLITETEQYYNEKEEILRNKNRDDSDSETDSSTSSERNKKVNKKKSCEGKPSSKGKKVKDDAEECYTCARKGRSTPVNRVAKKSSFGDDGDNVEYCKSKGKGKSYLERKKETEKDLKPRKRLSDAERFLRDNKEYYQFPETRDRLRRNTSFSEKETYSQHTILEDDENENEEKACEEITKNDSPLKAPQEEFSKNPASVTKGKTPLKAPQEELSKNPASVTKGKTPLKAPQEELSKNPASVTKGKTPLKAPQEEFSKNPASVTKGKSPLKAPQEEFSKNPASVTKGKSPLKAPQEEFSRNPAFVTKGNKSLKNKKHMRRASTDSEDIPEESESKKILTNHEVTFENEYKTLNGLYFSFEGAPVQESWYQTYQRYIDGRGENNEFIYEKEDSLKFVLPYEMPKEYFKELHAKKLLLARKRNELAELVRKSPRCHASTLALFSNIFPGRKRKSHLKKIAKVEENSSDGTNTPISEIIRGPLIDAYETEEEMMLIGQCMEQVMKSTVEESLLREKPDNKNSKKEKESRKCSFKRKVKGKRGAPAVKVEKPEFPLESKIFDNLLSAEIDHRFLLNLPSYLSEVSLVPEDTLSKNSLDLLSEFPHCECTERTSCDEASSADERTEASSETLSICDSETVDSFNSSFSTKVRKVGAHKKRRKNLTGWPTQKRRKPPITPASAATHTSDNDNSSFSFEDYRRKRRHRSLIKRRTLELLEPCRSLLRLEQHGRSSTDRRTSTRKRSSVLYVDSWPLRFRHH